MAQASSDEHCGKSLVRTYWASMMETREEGEENRKYYEEDTAFCGLWGEEISAYAKDFSDSFF